MGEMLRDPGAKGSSLSPGSTLFEQWLSGTSAAAVKAAQGKKAPPASDYSKGAWIRTLNMQVRSYEASFPRSNFPRKSFTRSCQVKEQCLWRVPARRKGCA
jgi:hypothetical protein